MSWYAHNFDEPVGYEYQHELAAAEEHFDKNKKLVRFKEHTPKIAQKQPQFKFSD